MGCLLFLSSSSSLKPTAAAAAAAVFVFQITFLSFLPASAHPDPEDDIATTSAATPPPPIDLGSPVKPNGSRPSIAVIVGVLTTLFTVTFLLLLYARHCKRGTFVLLGPPISGPPAGAGLRKNSGIDRAVVESLPVFRFGSLRGHKDGLDCAVCLTRFEPTEVLRLLPKCKHAFHVECVDTWLDAHSTCPLCRYRVDPEDILLIEEGRLHHQNSSQPPNLAPAPPPNKSDVVIDIENEPGFRRVSGRHSSALDRPVPSSSSSSPSIRRSLDSWTWLRRSREPSSATAAVTSSSTAAVTQDRPRKDGLLLSQDKISQEKTRLEHRIIVSSPRSSNPGSTNHNQQRWSDVQPSDLFYLQSEMIMMRGDNNGAAKTRQRSGNGNGAVAAGAMETDNKGSSSSSSLINERSVSEITGLSRFSTRGGGGSSNSCNGRSNNNKYQIQNQNQQRQQQRQHRLVSRWVAWISSQSSHPHVRSDHDRTTITISPTPPPPPPPPLPTARAV